MGKFHKNNKHVITKITPLTLPNNDDRCLNSRKEMEKESHNKSNNINNVNNNNNNHIAKDKNGLASPSQDASSLLLRASSADTIIRQVPAGATSSSDLLLRWGNRKRLRCMKIQVKDDSSSATVQRTTVRVDRRVVKDPPNSNNNNSTSVANNSTTTSSRYPNLRQRSSSPQQPPPRILRFFPFSFSNFSHHTICIS